MSEIEPALTPEEWGAKSIDAHYEGDGERSYVDAQVDKGGYLSMQAGDDLDYYGQGSGRVGRRHALAALCLHDQPFGFTREDVDQLRRGAERADYHMPEYGDIAHTMLTLADRIEALLPPEDTP